jgi:hypothetical protein
MNTDEQSHQNDSVVRWQQQAMGQLSGALNLVLTLDTATTGLFCILNRLKDARLTARITRKASDHDWTFLNLVFAL